MESKAEDSKKNRGSILHKLKIWNNDNTLWNQLKQQKRKSAEWIQQKYFRFKIEKNKLGSRLINSHFLGGAFMASLYGLAFMLIYSLWRDISIWLFLAGVGTYFIWEDTKEWTERLFQNFNRND